MSQEFKPGIYLEVKKGTIGTGVTAKSSEFKNFWLVMPESEGKTLIILLDEDFKLTGLKETVSVKEFETGRFTYIPQGEKRYNLLINQLEKMKQEQLKKKSLQAQKASEAAPKKAANWWEAPEKDVKPGDIFDRGEKPEKDDQGAGSGNWWEGPKKDIQPGDIFKRDDRPAKKAEPTKKKSEVKTKKSWWDN